MTRMLGKAYADILIDRRNRIRAPRVPSVPVTPGRSA